MMGVAISNLKQGDFSLRYKAGPHEDYLNPQGGARLAIGRR